MPTVTEKLGIILRRKPPPTGLSSRSTLRVPFYRSLPYPSLDGSPRRTFLSNNQVRPTLRHWKRSVLRHWIPLTKPRRAWFRFRHTYSFFRGRFHRSNRFSSFRETKSRPREGRAWTAWNRRPL